MSLSEERLREIAANLPPADADLSRRERDAHALLAEVKRLRAGIASARGRSIANDEEYGTAWALEALWDDLAALLNPTGGETHE